jgi:hypothetical protein
VREAATEARRLAWARGSYDDLKGADGKIAEAWARGFYDALKGEDGKIAQSRARGSHDALKGADGKVAQSWADGKHDDLKGPDGTVAQSWADGKHDAQLVAQRTKMREKEEEFIDVTMEMIKNGELTSCPGLPGLPCFGYLAFATLLSLHD